ncbi:hypothetical protein [Kribbella sp. CA-294648]|uniref:hypothetical protein n=1 Tax=Kribbella sp. CA-294648 TaxID=3239948 RepID=UPI003D8A8709
MSKFLGFLLGIAVALVGPAMFGVLAADGGIKLNAKEMALAYGIGALIFWTVVSYFSGAAALGAALTFGAMIYTVHWIPNRTTNFLNDVPGVTTGMIDGIKQYTQNGVVPILAVISLVFAIQSIVRTVQQRRRERAEAERLQREQEAAVQAQQVPEAPAAPAAYPVAGGDYQPDSRFASNFGNSSYDDLFEEEPTPFKPRSQADEQTAQFAPGTAVMPADRDETPEAEETRLVPTDADETVMVPTADKTVADGSDADQTVVAAPPQSEAEQPVPVPEPEEPRQVAPRVAGGTPEAGTPQAGGPEAAQGVAPQTERPEEQQVPAGEPEAPERMAPSAAPMQGGPAAGAQVGGQGAAPQEHAEEAATQQVPVDEPRAEEAAAQQVPVSEPERQPMEETQPMPVNEPKESRPQAPQAAFNRREEVGQQYRERMDPPDVDDTGEFHVGAFEAPPKQTMMEFPGQFRS